MLYDCNGNQISRVRKIGFRIDNQFKRETRKTEIEGWDCSAVGFEHFYNDWNSPEESQCDCKGANK
jgi:hypothetical protein